MFFGRREYLEDLEALWRKKTSSLVACRGRRRIGKSTLFREFARRTAGAYLEFEGLPPRDGRPVPNAEQLSAFAEALARQTDSPILSLPNWYDAFFWLDRAIDDSRRTVVLLDEISWMGADDPNFPGTLRTAWETFFHRHEKLVVVICGSVSAWIQKNILGNTGFTGRFSRDYVLSELPLRDCASFWGAAAERISSREILDFLSVSGGVPRYIEEIDPGLPADENIRRLCFTKGGTLFQDFDAIFNPMFGPKSEFKKRILRLLSDAPLAGSEIATRLDEPRNGHLSDVLRELSEGGFISDDLGLNPETGAEARIARYRLRDNYTRFYLKYVEPNRRAIARGAFRFASLSSLPGWDSIMGLAFENLIVNNAMDLAPLLGIGNATIVSAAPYRHVRRGRDGSDRGCQIDLLVQTPRAAYVVEVKRKARIGREIEDEMETRLKRLPLRKGVSARPVLVFDGELDPVVEGDGYFDAVIPASKLLGL
jgi:AAA+ ATPase superfamily predicted ATPase